MCSQQTDSDYDKATPAELFDLFHQALVKLLASDDAEIEYSQLPSGGTVFALVLTDYGREVLEPIARPFRHTPEHIASLLIEDGVLHVSDGIQ